MPTARSPRLPQFLGVGPPRTGTTWLHNVLEGHVDLPYGVKETLYFTTFYDKGFDWYARHFRYATGERKVAEICPYFFDVETLDRIKAIMPDCRIITTMRDPVDRLYSMYKALRYSAEARRGTFEQTLAAWPSMAKGNRYAAHYKLWFENFGRENVLITRYEELRSDPQKYVNRVTDFMGIERIDLSARPQIPDDVNGFKRAPKNRRLARKAWKFKYWLKGRQAYGIVNMLERAGVWDFCAGRGELYPSLTPEQDARLRARFVPEVDALEALLKQDFSTWRKPRTPRAIEDTPQALRSVNA
jgi:Sulfotransferase domain